MTRMLVHIRADEAGSTAHRAANARSLQKRFSVAVLRKAAKLVSWAACMCFPSGCRRPLRFCGPLKGSYSPPTLLHRSASILVLLEGVDPGVELHDRQIHVSNQHGLGETPPPRES